MSREVKRVPLDFDHPLNVVWPPYQADTECPHPPSPDDWCKACSDADEPPTGEGWQLWETVSEGSPVTPVFASAEELVNFLTSDYATTEAGWHGNYSQRAAENLVHRGWAPSGISVNGGPFQVGWGEE